MSCSCERTPAAKRRSNGRSPEQRLITYRSRRIASLLACGLTLMIVSTTVSMILPGPSALARSAGNIRDSLAATTQLTMAYVANHQDNTVTPINTATNTAGTPIPVGKGPFGVAITPDGAIAYVVNSGDSLDPGNTVTPINTATNRPETPIPVGSFPSFVAISPDGTTAYVTNQDDNSVTPIHTATNTPGTPIQVGSTPTGIAVRPDGATAYVVNRGDNTVVPINTANNTTGTPIPVGSFPEGIAITPDGATAYVTNGLDNTVTPIKTATNTPETPIPVGSGPIGVAITADGKTVYIANEDNTVTPINTATNTPGTSIPFGVTGSTAGIAITPDGTTAYVTNANPFDNSVTPINTATNTPGTPIPVGNDPVDIAIARLSNVTPQASFGVNQLSDGVPTGNGTVEVSLDGCASNDAATYTWTFAGGQEGPFPDCQGYFNLPSGPQSVTLTVVNAFGQTSSVTNKVDVLPIAGFTTQVQPNGVTSDPNDISVDLNDCGSSGATSTYVYVITSVVDAFGKQQADQGPNCQVDTLSLPPGQYTVTLTVTDAAGEQAVSKQQLQVNPNIFFSPNPANPFDLVPVTLNCTVPGGQDFQVPQTQIGSRSYSWQTPSGTTLVQGPSCVFFTTLAPGLNPVSVTVYDRSSNCSIVDINPDCVIGHDSFDILVPDVQSAPGTTCSFFTLSSNSCWDYGANYIVQNAPVLWFGGARPPDFVTLIDSAGLVGGATAADVLTCDGNFVHRNRWRRSGTWDRRTGRLRLDRKWTK